MNEIELWEQEIENSENTVNEETIYNFTESEEKPVEEGFFSNIGKRIRLHLATWELGADIQSALASALYRYGADVSLSPYDNYDFINGFGKQYTMIVDTNRQYRQVDYGSIKTVGDYYADRTDDSAFDAAYWDRRRKYNAYNAQMKQQASMDVSAVIREYNKEIINDVIEDTGLPVVKVNVARDGMYNCVVVTLSKMPKELISRR